MDCTQWAYRYGLWACRYGLHTVGLQVWTTHSGPADTDYTWWACRYRPHMEGWVSVKEGKELPGSYTDLTLHLVTVLGSLP